jgi:integrase
MNSEIVPASEGSIVFRPQEREPVAYSDVDYSVTVETARHILMAKPANTRLAYDRAWTQFLRWCAGQGRVPVPATKQTLAQYADVLIGIGFAPNTIEQAIGVIRAMHRDEGFPGQPDTVRTMELLRDYRRAWADAGGRVRKRTPILIPALRAMTETCDPETPAGIRDRAMLLLGFNIMGRRSEISRINLADLIGAGENGIEVYIPYSKTDQEAKGEATPVPYGMYERTCPVRAVRKWTDYLASEGITSGPLFRPVDRHGRIGSQPEAAGHGGDRLSGHAINDVVQRRALLAGLKRGATPEEAEAAAADSAAPQPGNYGAHGLRSGAATSAYANGATVADIAKQGRWNPESPVILGYIRAVDKWKNNPMIGIGL